MLRNKPAASCHVCFVIASKQLESTLPDMKVAAKVKPLKCKGYLKIYSKDFAIIERKIAPTKFSRCTVLVSISYFLAISFGRSVPAFLSVLLPIYWYIVMGSNMHYTYVHDQLQSRTGTCL